MAGRILLATDLDRTLLPNGPQPESAGARALFAQVAARPEVVLAYVSGRHRGLVEAAMAEFGLPRPDYVIGDVGTTLYRVDPAGWHADPGWAAEIGRDWPAGTVAACAAVLAPIAGLRMQEPDRQNPWKLSYYAQAAVDPGPLLEQVRARLRGVGIACNLVWSVDETRATGLLDILPAGAGKLHALEFLVRGLGLETGDALFAGDSGNDLEVLGGPIPSVLVANAEAVVRRAALDQAAAHGNGERLYLAHGGWLGMNGNYSAGILEGLAHFHPQTQAWLTAPLPGGERGRGEGGASAARQHRPASPATPATPSPGPSPVKGEGGTRRPLIFGEVLFDRFPDGSEVLGGAPFNAAWHLQGFGAAPLFVSRVGRDPAGAGVLRAMREWGMDTSAVQTDPQHATGSVEIELDRGEPRYRIQPDQAYGHIDATALPDLGAPALLYHGSLALWRRESRATLEGLLRRFAVPVFLDVNLRPPWWEADAVAGWLERATWVKLNRDELDQLEAGDAPAAERAAMLCRRRRLEQAVVTLGGEGAIAVDRDGRQVSVQPVDAAAVVDTVGAGDAFAAVLMLGLLGDWELAATLRRAQQFASAIVGVRGATVADPGFYRDFADAWRRE